MIFEDDLIYIEREISKNPWIKIFAKSGAKELSLCDDKTRNRLFEVMLISEKIMLDFFKPDKINIASFGNYVPKTHIHVIARFKNDEFFPESMWGEKQREVNKNFCEDFDSFCKILCKILQKI